MAMLIALSAQQAFGAIGCPFGTETFKQLAANGTYTLVNIFGVTGGPGSFMVLLLANDVLEYSPNAGTSFRLAAAAGSFVSQVYSDGFNVRIRNTGVADAGAVGTFITQLLGV